MIFHLCFYFVDSKRSLFYVHLFSFFLFGYVEINQFSFLPVFRSLFTISLNQFTLSMSYIIFIGSCKYIATSKRILSCSLFYSINPITLVPTNNETNYALKTSLYNIFTTLQLTCCIVTYTPSSSLQEYFPFPSLTPFFQLPLQISPFGYVYLPRPCFLSFS